jgi:hypothetical protein
MHEVVGESPNLRVRAFKDMDEAQRWEVPPFVAREDEE